MLFTGATDTSNDFITNIFRSESCTPRDIEGTFSSDIQQLKEALPAVPTEQQNNMYVPKFYKDGARFYKKWRCAFILRMWNVTYYMSLPKITHTISHFLVYNCQLQKRVLQHKLSPIQREYGSDEVMLSRRVHFARGLRAVSHTKKTIFPSGVCQGCAWTSGILFRTTGQTVHSRPTTTGPFCMYH